MCETEKVSHIRHQEKSALWRKMVVFYDQV